MQEEAVELRRAGAEGQLVEVGLLDIERQIDLVLDPRALLDLDGGVLVEGLEVPELIEPPHAEPERLGVEHAPFEQVDLAPDHLVVGGVVAQEGDAVDEVLLPFLQPDGHVDDRLAVDPQQLPGLIRAREQIGEQGHFVVPDGAIGLARHVERIPDHLFRVVVLRLQAREDALQSLGPEHVLPIELQGPDAVSLSLAHRNPEPHGTTLAVLGLVQILQLRLAHLGIDVPVVPIVRHQQVGILLEAHGPVRPAATHEGEQPAFPGVPHLALERPLAHVVVPGEGDVRHVDLGSLVDVERELHDPGSTGQGGDLVGHLGELEPLL